MERLSRTDALRWTTLLLGVAAIAVFWTNWAPVVVAAWVAHLARPLLGRFSRAFGGRSSAAGVLVVLLLVVVLVPLATMFISLGGSAITLGRALLRSSGGRQAAASLVSGVPGQPTKPFGPAQVLDLAREYGGQAWDVFGTIAEHTAGGALGLFLFVLGVYYFLVEGPRSYAWAENRSPLAPVHLRRLRAAFHEVGKGLLVGVGLTGLAQAAVATIAYFVLGIPRALVLGMLTFVMSLIPSVGTAIVWVPIAIGLAVTGRTTAAIVLVAIGVGVISTVDNILRPIFARYGELQLSSFALLLSMFGGLALFGGWGLALGPLVVRLAIEALEIAKEEHLFGPLTEPPADSRRPPDETDDET
jgi:predicted PurR-regulated permease PerM